MTTQARLGALAPYLKTPIPISLDARYGRLELAGAAEVPLSAVLIGAGVAKLLTYLMKAAPDLNGLDLLGAEDWPG